jgi:putative transposase
LHEEHARRVLTAWLHHYAYGRPHRSLGQLTPDRVEHAPPIPINLAEHRVRRRPILGGINHEYWITTAA